MGVTFYWLLQERGPHGKAHVTRALRYYAYPTLTVHHSFKKANFTKPSLPTSLPPFLKVHFTINFQVMRTRVERVNELRSLRTAPSVCVAHAQ